MAYNDYILSEQAALRKRGQQSIANQQAQFLGQQRGNRNLAKINKRYEAGYQPLLSQYGQRGLGGPNIQSGSMRSGLSKYAASLQEDLGTESQNMQDELNSITQNEQGQQADLEDFLAQLRLEKQRAIFDSASAIKSMGSY
jgi:hypothetical protein